MIWLNADSAATDPANFRDLDVGGLAVEHDGLQLDDLAGVALGIDVADVGRGYMHGCLHGAEAG